MFLYFYLEYAGGEYSPITPIDVSLKYRHSKHVHVVTGQHQLSVLSCL